MITSRQTNYWFAVWIACVGMLSTGVVSAASLTTIDAGEVRNFEQTYEEWVQSLAQSIAPENPNTVIVEIEYSNNPEDIQTYEELKAANHLPGLPDVSDPNFTYPSESPLYALVSKQRVKVIFENGLTPNQQKLLNEVLNSKLKLNRDRGDSFTVEMIEPSVVNSAKDKPTNTNNTNNTQNLTLALLTFAISILLASVFVGSRSRRNSRARASQSRTKPNETAVTTHLKVNHPLLYAKARSILNPIQLLLKANPKHLIEVVRNETAENLAIALSSAPESLAAMLLNASTLEQRGEIRQLILNQRTLGETISVEASRFQQTVLAARLYKLSKNSAQNRALVQQKIASEDLDIGAYIHKFEQANKAKLNLRQKMNQELQLIRERLKNKNLKSERKNEASL